MKTKRTRQAALLGLLGFLCLPGLAPAAPLAFNEVSLLVRLREPDSAILQQLNQRRLLRPLTADQQSRLQSEGASAALLQALRDPATQLPAWEASAFENWADAQKQIAEQKLAALEAEQAAQEAARTAALLAWQREQHEKAARERALAEAAAAAAREATFASDYPVYASYGYGGYGGYPYPPRPGCGPRVTGPSSSGIQWSNGTATTYTSPGLSYHPFGTNGAVAPSAPCPPASGGRSFR